MTSVQMGRGRGRDRDERAAAQRLDEPGCDEQVEARGGARQERPDGERGERGEEQPAYPPQVGQPARQRHRRDIDEEIAVDDPRRPPELGPRLDAGNPLAAGHVDDDRGQGYGGDHQLEPGQEHAGAEDGKQDERSAAAHRPSVAGHGPPPRGVEGVSRRPRGLATGCPRL
jgi:hypothetical protein